MATWRLGTRYAVWKYSQHGLSQNQKTALHGIELESTCGQEKMMQVPEMQSALTEATCPRLAVAQSAWLCACMQAPGKRDLQ